MASLGALAAVAALLMLLAGPSSAATLVPPGNLTTNEAWSAGGSPYQLVGVLRIPSGITLSIDAGAVVEYNASASIHVEGGLNVTGSATQWAVFGPNGYGPCVEVNGSGTANIRYAYFDWCSTGIAVGSGGHLDLSNSFFNNTTLTAVSVSGNTGGVLLSNNEIVGGLTGIGVTGGRARLSATGMTVRQTAFCLVVSGASDVTIRGHFFYGWEKAIQLSNAAWVNITDGIVRYGSQVLLLANRADHLNVSRNTLDPQRTPLSPQGNYHLSTLGGLSNSTFADNILIGFGRGAEEGVPPLDPSWGFELVGPSGPNTFSGNTIRQFDYGILIDRATAVQTVTGNTFDSGTETGLWLRDSTGAVVTGNVWTGERFPFEVSTTGPDLPQYYRHSVSLSNLVDDRPILYLVDAIGQTIDLDGGAGIVVLAGAHNVSLTGGALEKGLPSLLVVDSADVTVTGTEVNSSWLAVEIVRSQRVVLSGLNTTSALTCYGFRGGSANQLLDSNATECVHAVLTEGSEEDFLADGLQAITNTTVALYEGQNLTIRNTVVQDCVSLGIADVKFLLPRESLDWPAEVLPVYGTPVRVALENVSVGNCPTGVSLKAVTGNVTFRGVQVVQSDTGAHVADIESLWVNGSSFSTRALGLRAERVAGGVVEGSTFAGSGATGFACSNCTNVTVRDNLFLSNGAGLALIGGDHVLVTRNEFIWNTAPASTDTTAHAWDNGSVGNLWDTYTGLDGNGDGIGDTPFLVSTGPWGSAYDNYPITYRPDTVPPVANAGPDQTVDEDVRVYFTGYLSTDDYQVRVHLWTFVDGNQTVTLAGVTTWYVFTNPGRYTVTLTVIDWGGNRDTDTLIVTVRDRTGPQVQAGPDRTVDEDVPVLLDGTGTKDNDRNFPAGALFRWKVYDAQGVSTLLSPQANWTFAIPGRYRVTLEVTDAAGNTGSDEAWITVRDTTPPTVPPLTPPVAEEDTPFSVYASLVTDNDPNWPDGRVEWFELWSHGSMVARSDDSPGRFQVATPGTYTAFYFVSDAAGNVGQGNVTFRVKDLTPPDLSLYGPRSEEAGVPVTFDISLASDNDPDFPEGAQVQWAIRLPSGTITLDGPVVTYAFPLIGEFLVTLRVWDADRNLATTPFQVKIEDTRGPAVRIEGPATAEAGAPASFHANASDPSGLTQVSWQVTGLQFPLAGEDLNYVFPAPGLYELTASVADTYGNGANASWQVVVLDTTAPTALVALTPTPEGEAVRLEVNQSMTAAYIGADAVGASTITWGWDDGQLSQGATAVHAWAAAGDYTVTMTVADAAGNLNTTSFRVVVSAPPDDGGQPPGPDDGTTAPPVPTADVLSPLSLALVVVGIGAGVAVGFLVARRVGHTPPRR